MSKRNRQRKQKQREKRLRKDRNLRRNHPREREAASGRDEGPRERHHFDTERMLRAVVHSGATTDANDAQALQARLDGFRGRNVAELAREALARGGIEAAQELAYQAMEATSIPRALALAAKALELDPECCDALTLLAVARPGDPARLVEALEHAVHCGAKRLGDERLRGEDRGELGGVVEARPYLRARERLYATLLRTERRAEALAHGLGLLELDSSDRQGVRWSLLGVLLEFNRLDQARALRESFADDESGQFAWGAVLEEFLRAGPRASRTALARARRVQPDFETALVDASALPSDPDVRETFVDLGKAWITHGDAFDWLSAGAPLSTPEERESVCASFASPVAELLALGEPPLGRDWPDYVTSHGFEPAHVPELVRLLNAVEFDELDQEDPRLWAPIHATRVLGQLRAVEAIEPLVDFGRRHEEDDWLALEPVFELIGPPCIEALAQWLRVPVADEIAYITPIDSLVRIARAHPATRDLVASELAAVLLHFDRRPPGLNALLSDALCLLDSTAHRSLVRAVVESGSFDPGLCDDLETLEEWAEAESAE